VNNAEIEWRTYRSKFLIQAKQLSHPLVFVDGLGREHRGKKGDYLVESASGAQRIWPRRLFEDAYVLLDAHFPLSSGPMTLTGSLVSPAPSARKVARREVVVPVVDKGRSTPASRPLIA
jgi:hypothetical protein